MTLRQNLEFAVERRPRLEAASARERNAGAVPAHRRFGATAARAFRGRKQRLLHRQTLIGRRGRCCWTNRRAVWMLF